MSKPAIGTEVRIRSGPYDDDPWVCATVRVHLSMQFTATEHTKGRDGYHRILFGLYSSEGESWKRGW